MERIRVQEWRQGWPVVAGSALGLAAGYSSFPFAASLFIMPLAVEFGWSRGELAIGQSLIVLGAIIGPIVGAAIDRFGGRLIALWLIPLYIIALLALAAMPPSLPAYYLFMALLHLSGAGATAILYMREVAARFSASRGLALAIARIGVALSGLVLPLVLFRVNMEFGWRAGYVFLAAIALSICLPATLLMVCPGSSKSGSVERSVSPGVVTDWRRVLILALSIALGMGPVSAILGQLQPVLMSKGIEGAVAVSGIGVFSLSVATGAIIIGYLVDRIWAPVLGFMFAIAAVVGLIGLLILPAKSPAWMVYISIILIGLLQGAEVDLLAFLIARYFGLDRFSLIYGLVMCLLAASTAISAYFLGAVFDFTGSYDNGIIALSACLVLSGTLILTLGPYDRIKGVARVGGVRPG